MGRKVSSQTKLPGYFRNPNKHTPVKTFWPAYTENKQQYLHITRETTSEPVKSNFFARELNVWKEIVPNIYKAFVEMKTI